MAQEAQAVDEVVSKATPRPFVKYVGGKTQIVEELLRHVPEDFRMYHEPMAGGAALFWRLVRAGRLGSGRVALGDTNAALMDTYRTIRDNPDYVIDELSQLADLYKQKGEDLYYRIRDAWNDGYTSPARFIFLKQTSFNGLWRHNRSGLVNMPWGHYESPKILDAENLKACSQALQGAGIWVGSFEASVQMVMRGDVVYFDPPYLGCFDLYGPEGFSRDQHVELIQYCAQLQQKGVHVIYTNEKSSELAAMLEQHWPGHCTEVVKSRRYVNRDGSGREPVDDFIVF